MFVAHSCGYLVIVNYVPTDLFAGDRDPNVSTWQRCCKHRITISVKPILRYSSVVVTPAQPLRSRHVPSYLMALQGVSSWSRTVRGTENEDTMVWCFSVATALALCTIQELQRFTQSMSAAVTRRSISHASSGDHEHRAADSRTVIEQFEGSRVGSRHPITYQAKL